MWLYHGGSWQRNLKENQMRMAPLQFPIILKAILRAQKKTIRILSATILSVFVIIYVSSQIDVTGKAFESMMGLDYFTGAIIGFLIVLSYIFIGGFVAAVWSDMFQGILMFLGLVLLPIVVIFSMNGTPGIFQSLREIDPALTNVFGTSDDVWIYLMF